MICDCGLLTKKRTLLDGIKSLTGTLIVFKLKKDDTEELHLKRCCFMTLIPSLYTFVDKSWLTYADIIVFDPNTTQVHPEDTRTLGPNMVIQPSFKVKNSTLDRLQAFGDDQFKIVYVLSARLISPEYSRAINDLNLAYHKVISLDHILTDIKYKYSSAIHDNKVLVSNSQISVNSMDSYETSETSCNRCKNIDLLKESLKELKHESYDKINKTQYELKTNLELIGKLQSEVNKLRDENGKLKEINKSLYMNR